jgi:hypothetical protein
MSLLTVNRTREEETIILAICQELIDFGFLIE